MFNKQIEQRKISEENITSQEEKRKQELINELKKLSTELRFNKEKQASLGRKIADTTKKLTDFI